MTALPDRRQLTCPRCGAAVECRPAGGCWCADESFRMPLDAAAIAEGCLCPACLRKAAAEADVRPAPSPQHCVSGRDKPRPLRL